MEGPTMFPFNPAHLLILPTSGIGAAGVGVNYEMNEVTWQRLSGSMRSNLIPPPPPYPPLTPLTNPNPNSEGCGHVDCFRCLIKMKNNEVELPCMDRMATLTFPSLNMDFLSPALPPAPFSKSQPVRTYPPHPTKRRRSSGKFVTIRPKVEPEPEPKGQEGGGGQVVHIQESFLENLEMVGLDLRLNKKKKETKERVSPVVLPEYITEIPGDPTMYQCKVCKRKFKSRKNSEYHKYCTLGNDAKPYQCVDCGQGFVMKSHFNYHMKKHAGIRQFECPTCGTGFQEKGKLDRHMLMHLEDKPFVCWECDRRFATLKRMREHQLIHNVETPFACKYCDRAFARKRSLDDHLLTHEEEKKFLCYQCGKRFSHNWMLDMHLRMHNDERPFQCDYCEQAFVQSFVLKRHLQACHADKPQFICLTCGAQFNRKDNLVRHKKHAQNCLTNNKGRVPRRRQSQRKKVEATKVRA